MDNLFKGYLLVSDLDGTLLDSNKQISKKNKQAIEYFVQQGGLFTVATGRRTSFAHKVIQELPVNLPVILYNGGLLYDYHNKKTLKAHYLEENIKDIIHEIAKAHPDVGIQLYIEDEVCLYQEAKNIPFEQGDRSTYIAFDDTKEKKLWRKIFFLGEEKEIDRLEQYLATQYPQLDIARSGEYSVEILPKGINKGKMLEYLGERYQINPAQMIAIGDNMNDEQMLLFARHSFVVENATKRLKDKIKTVAPHHTNSPIDYVVHQIERMLKNNRQNRLDSIGEL